MESAFFIDLDGTLLKHSTNEIIDGAIELLNNIKSKGGMIIITTFRGDIWHDHPIYGKQSTLDALEELGIEYDHILFNVPSPRIIMNDAGVHAVRHLVDSTIDYNVDDLIQAADNEPFHKLRQ